MSKAAERSTAGLVVLVVPFGSVAVAAWLGFRWWRTRMLVKQALTGDEVLDSYVPTQVAAAVEQFGASTLRSRPELLRALVAILNNELPASRPMFADAAGITGDVSLGGGPSVGPMQVYRRTAKDLGLWSPSRIAAEMTEQGDDSLEREEFAQLAQDPAKCIRMGVAVFADKLRIAHDDVTEAVRRYNGGGDAAAKYRDRAVRFATETWGGLEVQS